MKVTAISIALLAAVTGTARASILLVDKGVSSCEIVVSGSAVRPVRFAAEELQHFVQQSTGAKLTIVDAATPGKGHIFLGANPMSAAVGVKPDDLPAEGFHLKTVGRDIHDVTGAHHRNTQQGQEVRRCGAIACKWRS